MRKLSQKTLIAIAAIALCIAQLAASYALFFGTFRQTENIVGFTVAIDAGHGGIDGGVVGHSGTRESDVNLVYAKRLGETFSNCGFRVVYTRENDGGLYGAPTNGFKRRDMEKRREIILSQKADLVVSVHMNKFSDSRRSGPQVFFQEGDEKGAALAASVQDSLNRFTGNCHSALSGDYFITRTGVVGIIVECGFLSNPEEELLLLDSTYCGKLTDAVFAGIMLYLYEG